MCTIRSKAELTKVVNGLIEEGNPGQVREILRLMQKRLSWKYKEQSIHEIIDRYRGGVANDTRS